MGYQNSQVHFSELPYHLDPCSCRSKHMLLASHLMLCLPMHCCNWHRSVPFHQGSKSCSWPIQNTDHHQCWQICWCNTQSTHQYWLYGHWPPERTGYGDSQMFQGILIGCPPLISYHPTQLGGIRHCKYYRYRYTQWIHFHLYPVKQMPIQPTTSFSSLALPSIFSRTHHNQFSHRDSCQSNYRERPIHHDPNQCGRVCSSQRTPLVKWTCCYLYQPHQRSLLAEWYLHSLSSWLLF